MPTSRRKDDPGPDQIPFPFKIPRVKGKGSTDNPGRVGAKPVAFAYAYCSHHGGMDAMEKRTGLILSGKHLVWKVHYVVLGKGTPVPCRASGVALCVAHSRDDQMVLNQTPKKRDIDPMHGVRTARCFHPNEAQS